MEERKHKSILGKGTKGVRNMRELQKVRIWNPEKNEFLYSGGTPMQRRPNEPKKTNIRLR